MSYQVHRVLKLTDIAAQLSGGNAGGIAGGLQRNQIQQQVDKNQSELSTRKP
jgi:hypothetical protein